MSARSKVTVAVAAALLMVGIATMAAAQPSGDGLDDQRPVAPGGMMRLDVENMSDWMDQMHADPDRMLELHDEMAARYPEMQAHMDELGRAPRRDGKVGAHCSGSVSSAG